MHRIFVVGCARSGTTVAQALLASHRRLVTLPETHFFADLAHPSRIGRLLGLASRTARQTVEQVAAQLEVPGTAFRYSPWTEEAVTARFVEILDQYADREGACGWVEKTPYHLRRIDEIEQHVSSAQFCHILRRGPDVVASLYEVTRRHPSEWGGARSLEECVTRWLDDVETSLELLDRPRHVHLEYGRLTTQPAVAVEEAWEALELPEESLDREAFEDARRSAVPSDAPWQEIGNEVAPRAGDTLRRVLTAEQQEWVQETLRREGRRRGLYWRGSPLFE